MKTMKYALQLCLIAVFITACKGEREESAGESADADKETMLASPSTVQVVRKSDLIITTVENTAVSSKMSITGRVVPRNTTELVSEVQGRIIMSNKPFKAGSSYQRGETILSIDSQEFALNLESQKSAFLNILIGMMPDMKADYAENYPQWLAYIDSYQTGKALPSLPEPKSNPEKYFLTSQQVYNTYYNIKAQEERLSKFRLKAPYAGSLSVAMVDNGGLVTPGQPLGTYISDGDYEIESAVPLKLAQVLEVGQLIEFSNQDLQQHFTAKVTRINNIVDPATQNIPVFLSISDPDLRSGMYLEGQVSSSTFDNAVRVPAAAVNRDNTVHILEQGVIRKVAVQVLNTTDREVVIQGLQDQDQLILTAFENPVSGLKIIE